ncbi:MAG: hypothetical protein Dbin4_00755 [Alphaproteobacteria bacterium]|nr:hypothetical protein [Alphaproteobacteria bacterium]
MELTEIVSAVTPIATLIITGLATLAAFRSADSARIAQQALSDAEYRAARRQIGTTAIELLAQGKLIDSRCNDLKNSYRTLFAFANRTGSGILDKTLDEIDESLKKNFERSDFAKLFTTSVTSLTKVSLDEIDRIQMRLSALLAESHAELQEFDQKHSSIEGQITPYREKTIRGSNNS